MIAVNKLIIKIVLIAIILVGAAESKAQFFSLGVKSGVMSSNLFSGQTPTMGANLGLMGELKFAKWLRLRTEANIMWSGMDKNFWEQNDTDYFAVGLPVILQFMPLKNFHIGIGPELDYLLAVNNGVMPQKRFNFGLLAHVEYRFFDRLGLGVRYVQNLGDFSHFKQMGESISSGNSASNPFSNYSIQVSLSYRFGKNK